MMWEYVPCNLCGADDYVVVYPSTVDEYTLADVDLYRQSDPNNLNCRIVKCRRCGLVYANPRESSALMTEIYRDVEDDAYLELKPAKDISYRWNIARLEKYARGGRILDVGCGHGFFLSLLDPARWERWGIEPARAAARYGRETLGLNIQESFFGNGEFPENYFDVVTMFHVLEHVGDPAAELRRAWKILRPGGYLYVEFPDFASVFARWRKRRWWYVMRFHTYYFTRATARQMLARAGFVPVDIHQPVKTWTLGYLAHKLKAYGDHYNFAEKIIRAIGLGNVAVSINPRDILGVIARRD